MVASSRIADQEKQKTVQDVPKVGAAVSAELSSSEPAQRIQFRLKEVFLQTLDTRGELVTMRRRRRTSQLLP